MKGNKMAKDLKLGNYTGFSTPLNRNISFKITKNYGDGHYDIKTKDLIYSFITIEEFEVSDITFKKDLDKEEINA